MCNMALVNGGDAVLSDAPKRAKLTITKTEGMKVIGHRRDLVDRAWAEAYGSRRTKQISHRPWGGGGSLVFRELYMPCQASLWTWACTGDLNSAARTARKHLTYWGTLAAVGHDKLQT